MLVLARLTLGTLRRPGRGTVGAASATSFPNLVGAIFARAAVGAGVRILQILAFSANFGDTMLHMQEVQGEQRMNFVSIVRWR